MKYLFYVIPYKHTTFIPSCNDVETTRLHFVSTWNTRGVFVGYLVLKGRTRKKSVLETVNCHIKQITADDLNLEQYLKVSFRQNNFIMCNAQKEETVYISQKV